MKAWLQRARSVQQLVTANEAASQAAKASATALKQGADAAAAEHDAAAASTTSPCSHLTPAASWSCHMRQHAPVRCGWHRRHGTFAHINSFTEKPSSTHGIRTGWRHTTWQTGSRCQRRRDAIQVGRQEGELEEDSIADPLRARAPRVQQCCVGERPRATLRSGMAIDLHGDSLKVCRPYHVIAALPDSPAFARQIKEVLAAIKSPIDYGPELPTYYFGGRGKNGEWPTDPAILLERAVKMADKFRGRPPSALDEWPSPRKMGDPSSASRKAFAAPPGKRCGAAAEPLTYAARRTARAPTAPPIKNWRSRAHGPHTRALLRASILVAHHWPRRHWFVDWDRRWSSHRSTRRQYFLDDPHGNGGRVHCINGLEHRRFIHLDFLDFAMAVLLGEVNLGELHAIHDGFDCTTMTMMATSEHERHTSNFFAGTSEKAFITNVRHHFLVAVHLQLQMCGQTTHCCRTAENPADAGRRQFHFHSQRAGEAQARRLRHGQVVAKLLPVARRLPEAHNIWSDLVQVHEEFYSPEPGRGNHEAILLQGAAMQSSSLTARSGPARATLGALTALNLPRRALPAADGCHGAALWRRAHTEARRGQHRRVGGRLRKMREQRQPDQGHFPRLLEVRVLPTDLLLQVHPKRAPANAVRHLQGTAQGAGAGQGV